MNKFQVYIFFNMYMIRSIFFGMGIVDITKAQNNKLKKMYKLPIARKLNVGNKFPKKMMYMRRNSLGVGLI